MGREKDVNFEAASLRKKLVIYSAAAGAALSMASPANAAIRYSGLKDIPVNGTNPEQYIDLNGDGVNDIRFLHLDTANPTYYSYQGVLMGGATTGNSVLGAYNWWIEPYRLTGGEKISAGAQGSWYLYGAANLWSRYRYATYGSYFTWTYGNFINQAGYIGVRFDINGNTHYGWIAYEGNGYIEGRISGWAYEDVADTAISAGDTCNTPIPTLNQWGIIFLMGLILVEGARRIKRSRDKE